MRKAIYTINFNGYDHLKEPKVITPGWDYICFTDNKDHKSEAWQLVTDNHPNYEPHILSRYYYMNSQTVLSDYDLTIMIGGQIGIRCDLNSFMESCSLKHDLNMAKHPRRVCTYREAGIVIGKGFAKRSLVNRQMNKYRKAGFPRNYGLYSHGVIVRQRNDRIKALEEMWFKEVLNHSHRDQLSMMYCLWKLGNITVAALPPYFQLYNGQLFTKHNHLKSRINVLQAANSI